MRRIMGKFSASRIKLAPSVTPQLKLISMFDWPEQSQTSPTSTLALVMVFLPVTTSGRPLVLAARGARRTSQSPLSSAVVLRFWPAKATATSSPGSAVPQTGTSMPRCSTMLLVKIVASLTLANRDAAYSVQAAARRWRGLYMFRPHLGRLTRACQSERRTFLFPPSVSAGGGADMPDQGYRSRGGE